MTGVPSDFQPLTAEAVRARLVTKTLGRTLHVLEETPSTNTTALTLAQQGAEDGTVIVADRQTAGRGRLGRHWHSPPGVNLYCSVILRRRPTPERRMSWLSWVPLLSAVAVARAVQAEAGVLPTLKWPNDLMVGQRKLGGLLCESGGLGELDRVVVVGLGLNVNAGPDAFPGELREVATSLACETGRLFDRAALLASVLAELEHRYDAFPLQEAGEWMHEYATLCSTLGRSVRAEVAGGETLEGWAEGIGSDGSLRIRLTRPTALGSAQAGLVVEVRAADIMHVR